MIRISKNTVPVSQLLCVVGAMLAISLCVKNVYAAPKKFEVPCPKVIGDPKEGTYKKGSKYNCYETGKKAKKGGYMSASILDNITFQGWYRIRLTHVSSTCPGEVPVSGPVVFAQVLQSPQKGVFADFCPTVGGKMSGSATSTGVSASLTTTVNEFDNPLGCAGKIVEVTKRFELSPVVAKDHMYEARYSLVRRCPSDAEADKICVMDYSGPAFLETHEIWPPVAADANHLPLGCNQALQACSGCHPGMVFAPDL